MTFKSADKKLKAFLRKGMDPIYNKANNKKQLGSSGSSAQQLPLGQMVLPIVMSEFLFDLVTTLYKGKL